MNEKPYTLVLHNPGIDEAAREIMQGVAQKDFMIMLARCSVEYEGRGASKLGPGDRLIIVKPDGAVLVHRPTGYSPVNWQPESHVINVDVSKDAVVLRSVRRRPKEILVIRLEQVYLLVRARGLTDKAEFIEYMDEAEISDYIARHPEVVEQGLQIISRERRVGEGYVDILARDKDNNYVIIEVKRITANEDAVKQLYSYVEELRKANPEAPIRGILVAPSITKDALILLNSLGLEYKQIDPAKLYREAKKERHSRYSRSLLEYLGRKEESLRRRR